MRFLDDDEGFDLAFDVAGEVSVGEDVFLDLPDFRFEELEGPGGGGGPSSSGEEGMAATAADCFRERVFLFGSTASTSVEGSGFDLTRLALGVEACGTVSGASTVEDG